MTRARVLVVDVDPDVAELLRDDLEAVGHQVEVAVDADGALSLLADVPPDVVLLDLATARGDRWRVLDELQGEPALADVGVVMLTSSRSGGDPLRTLLHGSVRCLDEPFAPDRVLRTIDEVVAPVPAHVRADRRLQLRGLFERVRGSDPVGAHPAPGPAVGRR